jgi:hypothetical protein
MNAAATVGLRALSALILLDAFLSSVAFSAPPIPGHIIAPQFDNNGTVIDIDPVTGNRTTISLYPSIGTGPRMQRPTSIALAPDGNYLVTESFIVNGLYEIDPNSGNRTFVAGLGDSPSLGYPTDRGTGNWDRPQSVLVGQGGQIIVVNSGGFNYTSGFVTRVDLSTGNATLISGLGTGSGPAFVAPQGGAIDSQDDLVIADEQQILDVDLSTGVRSVLSGTSRGTGPAFSTLRDLVILPTGTIIATGISGTTASLFSVDPTTGNRSIIESGINTQYDYQRIALGANGTVLASLPDDIYAIDPITGNRTLISGTSLGSGPSMFWGDMYIVPVPEPSSFILGASALVLIFLARRASSCDRLSTPSAARPQVQ